MAVNSQDEASRGDGVFWKKQLANLDADVFPRLLSSEYIPNLTARTQHTISIMNQHIETVADSLIQLAWGLLIAHHTSNWDVLFGVILSGGDSIIIPMRLLLQPEERVSDTLEKIQVWTLKIQQLEADSDEVSIDVGCQIQSILYIQHKKEEKEVKDEELETDLQAISLVLRVIVCYISSKIEIQARYDPHVIPKSQVDRILHQLEHVYQQMDIPPHQEAQEFPTLNQIDPANNPNDLTQLHLWNNVSQSISTPQQHRVEQCVHTLIASVALTSSNSPAVSAWDGQMTYYELNSYANQLAKHLTTRMGVGPEVMVPLYFEKSMWTTVAMLGVMKAGGAFVLLDSLHPVERLKEFCRLMWRSSGVKVVVCSERNQTRAKGLLIDDGEVVVLSERRMSVLSDDKKSSVEGTVEANPKNAIYAVFTSGSTGMPKGIVMTHSAVCSAAAAYSTSLHLGPHSRVMQFASYAWDVSIYDMLLPLMVGGCICIPSDQDRVSNLGQAINDFNSNWITLTPSVARILDPDRLPCLEVLILVGEPLRDSDIRQWSSSHITFIPGYGATEVSLRVAMQPNCRPHDVRTGNSIDARNIGSSALAGGAVCCWIVDPHDHNRLSPIGAIGELVIEGPTLARGYLNDPETTARVFIDHPPAWLRQFRGNQAGRLYKMGDLVQYTGDGDGSMRYIGRKDTQVKIRGQRLELEDVAYHVRACFPGPVKHGVAELLTLNDVAVLIVFIVHDENKLEDREDTVPLIGKSDTLFMKNTATALSELSSILPPYMLPTLFIPLNRIPLTASGKLNRRLLKAEMGLLSLGQLKTFKVSNEREASATKRAPTTVIEEKLQRLVATVLSISPDQIGIDDHFFRLGGDSLSAMKLVALAQDEGYSFSVEDVFTWPRAVDLSRKMEGKEEEKPIPPFSLVDNADEIISAFLGQAEEKNLGRNQIEDIYPTTPMQDGLMALSLKTPGSYVHTFTYHLKPKIDFTRFRAAFDSTVAANPIMRTQLTQTEKGTFQVVIKEESASWKIYESQEEYDRKDHIFAIGLNHRLLHVGLITSSPPRFLMTMHHAMYDGWSLPLLWEEIATRYHRGYPPSKQASPYNRFLRWIEDGHTMRDSASFWRSQYASMNAAVFPSLPSDQYTPTADKSLTYCIEVAPLPGWRSGLFSSSGYTMSTYIRLAWAIIVSHYTDCNDVLFGIVLSGRTAPVAGIDTMTGPTLTAVPFRTIIKPEFSIDKHLNGVQQQVAAMIPHEQMGLHNIRKVSTDAARACEFQSQLAIQPATDETISDLLFTAGSSQADVDYAGIVGYAFMLNCHLPSSSPSSSSQGLLKISARYDSNVVDSQQAQRMIAQFEHVLQQILVQSGNTSNHISAIHSISVVSPQDWQQLTQWNGTSLPSCVDHCVHDLILANSVVQPDSVAISAWDGVWTYGQLDIYSSRLASQLKSKYGLQRNCVVPVCFERSKWAILAIVAVLRVGGTLLCLDHKYPAERLQFILDMVKPKLVLCSGGADMENKFAGRSAATVVAAPFFNEEEDEKEKELEEEEDEGGFEIVASSATSSSSESFEQIISPSSLAYIAFTSGSTGQPKGIEVEHRNLSTAIQSTRTTMKVSKTTRAMHFGSYSFDVTLYEIFAPLVAGGCVCIPSESDRMNALAPFITRHRVNWMAVTPSVLAILDPESLPTVATVVTAGESLTRFLVNKWASRVHLVNAYGPAETTIYSTAGHVPSNDTEQWKSGTIGPMLGAVGWITVPSDPSRLAPLGAVGELLIEGPIVSRGYLERPDLTAQSYINSPDWLISYRKSSSVPAGRLYRSGDLVVLTNAGEVRFIGRKDTQVKIRGQRIELAEAEHHLRCCLADFDLVEVVVDVAVVRGLNTTKENPSLLIAYIAQPSLEEGERGEEKGSCVNPLTDAFQNAIHSARNKLHNLVPAYMIPSIFIPLTRIPHTNSGKTDRRYLRTLFSSLSPEDVQGYHHSSSPRLNRQPSTTFETLIHGVWAQVLNKDPPSLGVDDNFFHLGGDSISAMQLVSQLAGVGVGTTVDAIFSEPTVARLASVSAKFGGDGDSQNALEQGKVMTDVAFNLSAIQNLLINRATTKNQSTDTDYNQFSEAVLLDLTRHTTTQNLLHAIRSIVQKHPMLRARFRRDIIGSHEDESDEWSQKISSDLNASFKYREHSSLVSMEEAQEIIAESRTRLNIHQGPLLVADLMKIQESTASGSRQYLSLVAHQLVMDDRSFEIVCNDLEQLLSSSTNNGTSEQNITQSSSVLQYPAWCAKQQKYFNDSLSHIKSSKLLIGRKDCIPSQYWGHNATEATYDNVIERGFLISDKQTALLLSSCSSATADGNSNTAFGTVGDELIHAALVYSFLHVFQDRTSPTVFKVEDGRKILWEPHLPADVSDTVGCFTNLWPYHVDVDVQNIGRQHDLMEVVRKTKDSCREGKEDARIYLPAAVTSNSLSSENLEIVLSCYGLDTTQQQKIEKSDSLVERVTLSQAGLVSVGSRDLRLGLINIKAELIPGPPRLAVNFTYPASVKHQSSLMKWAEKFQQTLFELAAVLPNMSPRRSRSDFLQLGLTDAQFERLYTNTDLLDKCVDAYPCSPIQHGMFLSRSRGHTNRYKNRHQWTIQPRDSSTSIDCARLLNAWEQLVARHSLLRTIFVNSARGDGSMDQIVLPLKILQEQQEALHSLTLSEPNTETGNSVACLLEIDHALMDGMSLQILLRDLALAYDGCLNTKPDPVFHHYVSYIRNQPVAPARKYWENYIEGMIPCLFPRLALVTDHDNYDEVETASFTLHESDLLALRIFCAKHETTQSTIFQLAWALVLRIYTRTNDVCFGYLTSGRDAPIPGIQEAVGPFLNMLLCRIIFSEADSTMKLLKNCQMDFARSLQFQYLPLAEITHHHHNQRGLKKNYSHNTEGRGALFNSIVTIHKGVDGVSALSDSSVPGVIIQQQVGDSVTEYDLVLDINLSHNSTKIILDYRHSHLTSEQSVFILDAFEQAIRSIIQSDGQDPAIKLPLLGGQSMRLVQHWNRDEVMPAVTERCVGDMIIERCGRQPTAPAICTWDRRGFTYAQLDTESLSLMRRIKKSYPGVVRPEVFVPIYSEKSPWVIVAMVAVMRAGGAFILLDPSHPLDRLRAICEDSQAILVLASKDNEVDAAHLASHVMVIGNDDQPPITKDPHFNRIQRPDDEEQGEVQVSPKNALYAIFTSGSTGRPKGVVIEHRAFATSALAHGTAQRLCPQSRVLQNTAYAFDVSLCEMLTAILHGACVCIPSEEQRQQGRLDEAAADMQVNWAFFTPSLARVLSPADFPSLRTLVLGGELAGPKEIEMWSSSSSSPSRVDLLIGYGPSECSVFCTGTLQPLDGPTADGRDIGRCLGSRGWIVDPTDHRILLPVGAVGELVIEGPILAREYLNAPETTKASFLEPPASSLISYFNSKSARMYKTGDLVRYNTDGTLHFIGRKDLQVKLRGQRFELAEVEYQLRKALPNAVDIIAEVVSISAHSANNVLAAFIFDGGNHLGSNSAYHKGNLFLPAITSFQESTQVAQAHLCTVLPQYMVPTMFLALSRIPLTVSGKTDRKQLHTILSGLSRDELRIYQGDNVIDSSRSDKSKPQPSSPFEEALHKIWARVLNCPADSIGINDEFFRIGGDSISSMQVVAQCSQAGLTLMVADIFQTKTIQKLALVVKRQEENSQAVARLVEEQEEQGRSSGNTAFDLSPIQQLFFQLAPEGHDHFNQSFFMKLKQTSVTVEALRLGISTLVRTHPMLRARFQKDQLHGRWTQVLSPELENSFTLQEHYLINMEEAGPILDASQTGLNIGKGPIMAVNFLHIADHDEAYIFMVVHHLVIDLVSWRVLLADLQTFIKNEETSRGTPSISFLSWCALQRKHICSSAYTSSMRSTIDDTIIKPDFPIADYWGLNDGNETFKNVWGITISESISINATVTQCLFSDANNALQTSPVDLFHAALLYSFVQTFDDRPAPVIFNEGHGREPWDSQIDISRTVGWFTTFWPALVPVSFKNTLVDVLRRVKDTRRSMPSNGWEYFSSRLLQYGDTETRNEKCITDEIEILFNYTGRYQQFERDDSILQPVPLPVSCKLWDLASDFQRFSIFDISASVDHDGCLRFNLIYPAVVETAHPHRMKKWMKCLHDTLNTLAHQLPLESLQHTLVDFPLLTLGYDGLDKLTNDTLRELAISSTEIEGLYPCAPIQIGILMSQAINASLYQNQFIWKFSSTTSGRVDVERVIYACHQVVRRHMILRTIFVRGVSGCGPIHQLVLKPASSTRNSPGAMDGVISIMEQSDRDEDEDSLLLRLSQHRRSIGEEDERKPPYQLLIAPHALSGNVFVILDCSHALVDGTSHQIIRHNLQDEYDLSSTTMATTTIPAVTMEVNAQYRDYIDYLHKTKHQLDSNRTYWASYLKDVESCFLPISTVTATGSTDQVTGQENGNGVLHKHKLPLIPITFLSSFCSSRGWTPSNLFQVAWGIVLMTYTSNRDVCFGYFASGRDIPIPNIQSIVGPLINALVCRLNFSPVIAQKDPTGVLVEDILRENQARSLLNLQHQHVSLSDILKVAGKGIGAGTQRAELGMLFNTAMSVQRATVTSSDRHQTETSIQVQLIDATDPSEYDIMVNIWIDEHTIEIDLAYWTPSISNAFAAQIGHNFHQTITGIVSQPAGLLLHVLQASVVDKSHQQSQYQEVTKSSGHKFIPPSSAVGMEISPRTFQRLQKIWGRLLNIDPKCIGLHDNFFRLGGDSISAMQMASQISAAGFLVTTTRKKVTMGEIFRLKTIAALSGFLSLSSEHVYLGSKKDNNKEKQAEIDINLDMHAAHALSPIQQLFFERVRESHNHFNQSFFLEVNTYLTPSTLMDAIRQLVAYHPMLRMKFRTVSTNKWEQVLMNETDLNAFRFRHTRVTSIDDISAVIATSQRALHIQHGPVFSVDLIDIEDRDPRQKQRCQQRLFMVAHHLVIDLVSWRIIFDDLEDCLLRGSISARPTLSFTSWCKLQQAHAEISLTPEQAFPYEIPPPLTEYWGLEIQSRGNVFGDTVDQEFTLDEDITRALCGPANDAYGTQPVELLQAALLESFQSTFSDRRAPTIFSEGHGREPWEDSGIDLSHTVGWFTTMWPTYIPTESFTQPQQRHDRLFDTIRRTKDHRRGLVQNGLGYFASRYLHPEGQNEFRHNGPVEILFNFTGSFQGLERADSLFHYLDKGSGWDVSEVGRDVERFAIIDVLASVVNKRLKFSFSYNRLAGVNRPIDQWIECCKEHIHMMAMQLPSKTTELTLTDLGLLCSSQPSPSSSSSSSSPGWTYSDLDTFIQETCPQMGLSPTNIESIYACAPIQSRMLACQSRTKGVYHVRHFLEVILDALPSTTQVDDQTARVAAAWRQVVNRHSVLRSYIWPYNQENEDARFTNDSIYNQIVLRSAAEDIITILSPSSDPLRALKILPPASLSVTAAGLGRPAHHLTMCELAGQEQGHGQVFCLLEINHAFHDGTSFHILLRDFVYAYNNCLPCGSGPSFQAYVEYLQTVDLYAAKEYWSDYLRGCGPTFLDPGATRPTDGKGQPLRSSIEEMRTLDFDLCPAGHRYGNLCRDFDFTLSSLVHVAWGLVLRKHASSADVCFGSMSSGRDVPLAGVINDAVGAYINMVVCRLNYSGPGEREIGLIPLLQNASHDYIQGIQHQHLGLTEIQRCVDTLVKPDWGQGSSSLALFNTAVSIQKQLAAEGINFGVDNSISKLPTSSLISIKPICTEDPPEYDTMVNVWVAESGRIGINMVYWTTFMSDEQASTVAETFQRAFSELCLKVGRSGTVGDLEI